MLCYCHTCCMDPRGFGAGALSHEHIRPQWQTLQVLKPKQAQQQIKQITLHLNRGGSGPM